MKILCIIPARGGSKGIPKKNIINFVDKPLISHSIIQSLNSKYITNVVVSSDSDEILELSKSYGATPLKRPTDLSLDTSSSESALLHTIETITDDYEYIVFLQATSPLRTTEDIDKCIETLVSNDLDSVFSASILEDMLIWKSTNNTFESVNYDYKNRKRRQDSEIQYVENGSIYVFKKDGFIKNNNRLFGKIGLSLMESWKMFEIDSLEDLELCEIIFKNKFIWDTKTL
jgi:CMP-N,N'-diacetyllegionaminic acid synthase